MASWKPSRMSMPIAAFGPDSVLTKPTRTMSAAKADAVASITTAAAAMDCLNNESITRCTFSCKYRRSDPDLQDIVERRLAVEKIDALQLDAQGARRIAHQRVAITAAEVAHVVATQLHHVETRTHVDRAAAHRFDRDMAHHVVGLPHRCLRPRIGMRHATLADLHHQLVLG